LSQALEDLDPAVTGLDHITAVRRTAERAGRGGELTAPVLLERFGFTGDRLTTRIGDLSGGERRRLQLLRIMLDEPNVLILDEPTNDLDVETLTVLEDFLDAWPGTLVVVTHDRYFLERVTDTVYAVPGDGTIRHLPGGVDQYLDFITQARAVDEEPKTTQVVSDAASTRAARKELARIERQLVKLTEVETGLHEQIAAHASDYERLTGLDAELRSITDQRAELEAAWFEAAERAE
jgi:ABC transport system ATP-binding/permease protein